MQATYIEVSAGVRYWEDASVNGTEDADGTLMPMRKGDNWEPVIRLADGAVMDWPQGTTADVHFKVCDEGEYWLLDDERKRVAKWAGFYVPDDFLCHGNIGYGDYIIFKVGADGLIAGWRQPAVEVVFECDKDAQHGWKKLPNEATRRARGWLRTGTAFIPVRLSDGFGGNFTTERKMDCNSIKQGLRVRTTALEDTKGMMIVPKHLECRAAGMTGTVRGYVPGHGGDVWFVHHDGSDEVGAYCFTELKPE